jgi:hypothetical protein
MIQFLHPPTRFSFPFLIFFDNVEHHHFMVISRELRTSIDQQPRAAAALDAG